MMNNMRNTAVNARAAAKEATHERKTMLKAYLSREHVEQLEAGCPLAALGSETSRQPPEVRHIATSHIKATIDLLARQSPAWNQPSAHEQALVALSTMVGAVMLAHGR
jgi:TetR/AcrR family transcriptional regulator, transcriptional repressor for nem operon